MVSTRESLPVFDFIELSSMPDPRPLYAEWRQAGPLIKGGPRQWGVTRHAEVSALLKDRRVSHAMPKDYTDFTLGSGPSSDFRQNSLLMKDGPPHHRLRQLMAQAFTPALVRQLRDRVLRLVDAMIEPLLDGQVCNLVELMAFPLPTEVICELMGIRCEDREEVRAHTARLFGAEREHSDAAVLWLRSYMERVLRQRRPDPAGDLLGRMMAAGEGDDALTHQEIVDNAVLLFFGGFETTRHLIAAGGLALAQRPDQFRRLRSTPSTPVLAVEELLRHDGPVRAVSCMVTEPLEVGDRVIKEGHVLYLLLGCANHDEKVFDNPGELDVERSPNPHVSFGGGPHRCLGMHLARLEAELVFRRLSERFDRLELIGEPRRAVSSFGSYSEVRLRAVAC